jgi:hypothetical protein
MIIFYETISGNIIGTIEGRIHSEQQLKMTMGSPHMAVSRIIVNWKQIPGTTQFAPDAPEMLAKVIILLDKNPSLIFKYRVDTKTGTLVMQ